MNLNTDLIHGGSYINGEWHNGKDHFPITNPATLETICQLHSASIDNVKQAISAAVLAQLSWKKLTAKERAAYLRRWYDLILENKHDLAAILTAEQGKPINESLGEIIYGANYIEWYAEEAKRVYGDIIPTSSSNNRIVVIKQPVGIVSAITPWNFPNAMITRKAAPALAAGCSFIIKPAQETPLSALALAQLADDAGIPPGVFNVVVSTQSQQIGKILTQDPRISKFTFTGSTEVGKILLEQCASTVKKVSMELGGNAPFIVFEDADIDAAVQGLIVSKFRNAGQTCVCSNRIFVQHSIAKKFTEKLITSIENLKIGFGDQKDTDIGPLINQQAVKDVQKLVDQSIIEGAQVKLGGNTSASGVNFFSPTVLTNVTPDMSIAKNEIFGPVAPIIEFKTEDELIKMANNTDVGLASYLYSKDIGKIWRIAEALEYGMVGVNEGIISNEMAPFGGVKQSGIGREGSKYGLEDYLEIKYILMGGINSA